MLSQFLGRTAPGSNGDAASADGGGAGDVLRCIPDDDDLLSVKLLTRSRAEPAHSDGADVIAMLSIVTESPIEKVFGEIKSAQLQLRPTPHISSQQTQRKSLMLKQIRQERIHAGQHDADKGLACEPCTQALQISFAKTIPADFVERSARISEQFSDNCRIRSTGEVQWWHILAAHLQNALYRIP